MHIKLLSENTKRRDYLCGIAVTRHEHCLPSYTVKIAKLSRKRPRARLFKYNAEIEQRIFLSRLRKHEHLRKKTEMGVHYKLNIKENSENI